MAHKKTNRERQLDIHKRQLTDKLSGSGVIMTDGIISREEYLRELSGKKGLEVYNKMRRSDGATKAVLLAIFLPILAAERSLNAANDSAEAETAKEIVGHSLFHNISFDDFTRQALSFLPMGFSVFEQVYDTYTLDGREWLLLSDMVFKKQSSVERWQTTDGEPGIQHLQSNGKLIDIPDVKITRFTFDQEGENYEGVSILRAAYKHWYMKTEVELVDAMAIEKNGLGIMKVRTPSSAKEDDKEKAREIAREQRANEEGYVEEEEGYDFSFMDMMARSTRESLPTIRYHKREIQQSALTQFLDIGSSGSSGSFSASDNQIDLFFMSENAVAGELAETINNTLVRNICILNGILPENYPKFSFGHIGKNTVETLSDAVNKLLTSGGLTPDPEVENYLRRFLRLPEMTEEMYDNYNQIHSAKDGAEGGTPKDAAEASRLIAQAKLMRDRLRSYAGVTGDE